MKTTLTRSENECKSIDDFTGQWQIFPDNEGYFVSLNLFEDSLAGLLPLSYFRGKTVGDLGSGTGRIVRWLVEAGAKHVFAIEPAESLQTLKANTARYADKITYLNTPGDKLDLNQELDAMVSLGVISYIPDLLACFNSVYQALKPGGKFYVLAMAYEGNELYCLLVDPIRKMTPFIPDWLLLTLCNILAVCASTYGTLAALLPPLPMHNYFKSVYMKMNWHSRVMLIFDQLNPTYAKYYRRGELESIFKQAGFVNLKVEHRHGYSWAVCAEKRAE